MCLTHISHHETIMTSIVIRLLTLIFLIALHGMEFFNNIHIRIHISYSSHILTALSNKAKSLSTKSKTLKIQTIANENLICYHYYNT